MKMPEIETVPAKTILHRTKTSAWFGTEYNMNIYRGCDHGCIYCDSRGNCYGNADFGRVRVKADALELLSRDLGALRRRGVIGTGAMSDPYNAMEVSLHLTRGALERIAGHRFGVAIATKSALVLRDVDVLCEVARFSHVLVKITITAADDVLCGKIEPNASPSSDRFRALRVLSDAGIFCGVLMMPLLPDVTDDPANVAEIVDRAADAGARFVYPGFGLSMRAGQREYLYEQLDSLFPGLRARYVARYGLRYACPSPRALRLRRVFGEACERRGLLHRMEDIVRAYRARHEPPQRELDFDPA